MKRLVLLPLALLAACATQQAATPDVSVPYNQREVQGQKEPSERAKIHTSLAANYYVGRNYAVALEEANKALQDDSSYVPALSILGLTYMELGQDGQAQQAFDKAISINPSDSDVRNNYGLFLCQRKQQEEGIKQFMLALRNPLYQSPERAWANAGDCARSKGDFAAAETYYTRALERRPGFGRGLLGLGELSYRRGDYKDSRAMLDRYAKENPPTAESLWLGVRTERKLGDRQAEADLSRQLRRTYPESPQAKLLQGGKFD
ncbi:MAG TPA: type IV pilus biogenesis/stability protein PilW [Burkholderiales bacterium]|nr:type IV pilus biogenesis/stability protein PilW [Burkholderiales bacterium]